MQITVESKSAVDLTDTVLLTRLRAFNEKIGPPSSLTPSIREDDIWNMCIHPLLRSVKDTCERERTHSQNVLFILLLGHSLRESCFFVRPPSFEMDSSQQDRGTLGDGCHEAMSSLSSKAKPALIVGHLAESLRQFHQRLPIFQLEDSSRERSGRILVPGQARQLLFGLSTPRTSPLVGFARKLV